MVHTTLDDLTDIAAQRAGGVEEGILTGRLFDAVTPALELLTVELGVRLGLYAALDSLGGADAVELATVTGVARRPVEEWLEQQSMAGILWRREDAAGAAPRYQIPVAHRTALLEPTSPFHAAGLASMVAGIGSAFDAVASSYLGERRVSFGDFGPAVRGGLEAIYRPAYEHALPSWFDAMPDVSRRLREGGLIVDVGCGTGWSSIAMARLFPRARVVGVDLDGVSIGQARLNAISAGVSDRVEFAEGDAADQDVLDMAGVRDAALVTVFLALHDINGPQRALSTLRNVLAEEGTVLIGDAKVADELQAPAGDLDRLFAAFSVLHCLPATLAEGDGHAHGTVLRAPTVHRWSEAAGYSSFATLEIEHPVWTFYRLDR